MKTITFKLQKGGTGATSTALSIAVELAKNNKKVIFIDADPQGNATSWLNFESINYELSDLLEKKIKLEQAILKTKIDNLFVIPTAGIGGTLSNVKDLITNDEPFIITELCEALEKKFDFCILDLSPSFSNFERSCYLACDEIIPVLLPDEFSIDGLEIFTNHIEETRKKWRVSADKMQFSKVVINKMNNQKSVSKAVLSSFKNHYSENNLFIIPLDPSYEKAQLSKTMIQDIKETKKETLQELKRIAESF